MLEIIRGTTPTFMYTPQKARIEDIAVAYITIISGEVRIEKELTEATAGETYLTWTLSQAESLSLADNATAMVNVRTVDGTRFATKQKKYVIIPNDKEEII